MKTHRVRCSLLAVPLAMGAMVALAVIALPSSASERTIGISPSLEQPEEIILIPRLDVPRGPLPPSLSPFSLEWKRVLPENKSTHPVVPSNARSPRDEHLRLGALLGKLSELREGKVHGRPGCTGPGDLVVGDDPPDEIVVIGTDTTVLGNICVMNSGVLRIEGATLAVAGNIEVFGSGSVFFTDAGLSVLEEWLYQYSCILWEGGRLEMRDSELSFGGQNYGLTGTGSSTTLLENASFPAGFFSVLLVEGASMEVVGSVTPGEYIPMDSASVAFNDCENILVWLTFPPLSEGSLELPGADSTVVHWEFPTETVSGIDYHISVDSTYRVRSGALTSETSNLTVTDSDLLALGLIFWEATVDTARVHGLVNDTRYEDFTLDTGDRYLRLTDSHVGAWNIYPFDSTLVRVENSIFGEILANEWPHAEVHKSICDGTGGYVSAAGHSSLFLVSSQVLTQTISRDRALMLLYETSLPTHKVVASGGSVMALLNSPPVMRPAVEDTALLLEAAIGLPSQTPVDAVIPVTGTAMITPAPLNPFAMDHYLLYYASGQDPGEADWVLIDSVATSVLSDTLGLWDTGGLSPGPYMLMLTVSSTYVDTVRLVLSSLKAVTLSENTGISPGEGAGSLPRETLLLQNFPNPFNPSTTVRFSLAEGGIVVLSVYDLRGRRVRTLEDEYFEAGIHTVIWDGTDGHGAPLPSGVYLLGIETRKASVVRKTVLLK